MWLSTPLPALSLLLGSGIGCLGQVALAPFLFQPLFLYQSPRLKILHWFPEAPAASVGTADSLCGGGAVWKGPRLRTEMTWLDPRSLLLSFVPGDELLTPRASASSHRGLGAVGGEGSVGRKVEKRSAREASALPGLQ